MDEFLILLYAGSGKENHSYRYRISHLKQQLDLSNIPCKELENPTSIKKLNFKNKKTILILHRTPWGAEISDAIDFARKNGIIVVYDIDDYVFEPKITKFVRGYEVLSDQDKALYDNGVKRYRRVLLECDTAICTTQYLADRIKELGISTYVYPNLLSLELIDLSEKGRINKKTAKLVNLGYFSGTYTHNADFAVAAPAILKILQDCENARLVLVGPLDLQKEFNTVSKKIIRKNLVSWKELPSLIAEVDINLLPLEVDNPFCESKSNIKFLEAGIAGVLTIASPTKVLEKSIRDGKNGFLAYSVSEWESKLRRLIDNNNLRDEISKTALDEIQKNYTVFSNKDSLKKLLTQISEECRSGSRSYSNNTGEKPSIINRVEELSTLHMTPKLSISFVAETPDAGQGGFQNITRACYYLSKFGHDVSLYVNPGGRFKSEQEIKDFIEKYYGKVNYSVKFGHSFSNCDILVATFWTTAYNVYYSNAAKTKIYFVQDFEPYFYQVGTEYVRAEKTYQLGLYHITSFPWLHELIQKRYGGRADYFLPPIDRTIYQKKSRNQKKNLRIAFYARPDQPRRCYDLGIQALHLVHQQNKEVEIILFGSDKINNSSVTFPHINKGKLPGLTDLAQLYQDSDIGIVFSTSNPSLLSFEMMACGCPVVDLDLEANRLNYSSNNNAILCEATPHDISNAILDLINNNEKRNKIAENGYSHSLTFPDVEGTAKRIEKLILDEYLKVNQITPVLKTDSDTIPDIVNVDNEMHLGEITNGQTIRQTFLCKLDDLASFSLLFGTFKRKNDCHILIRLEDLNGNEIYVHELSAKNIADNSWISFEFPEVANSKNQIYNLIIYSNDARSGNAVTIYASQRQLIQDGRLYINNILQKGALCLQTFCLISNDKKVEKKLSIPQINANESTNKIINLLSQKINSKNTKQRSLELRLNSVEETTIDLADKLNSIENKINALSDYTSSTKMQLDKLDFNIYKFSRVLPIRIGIQILRRFSKNE